MLQGLARPVPDTPQVGMAGLWPPVYIMLHLMLSLDVSSV